MKTKERTEFLSCLMAISNSKNLFDETKCGEWYQSGASVESVKICFVLSIDKLRL